jgi:hypothetical protein
VHKGVWLGPLRKLFVTVLLMSLVGAPLAGAPAAAQQSDDLSGVWMLNRDLSEFPREVGFDPDWTPAGSTSGGGGAGGGAASRSSGGRGGRGGGGGGGSARVPLPSAHYVSEEDVKKLKELVDEVKNPPSRVTIAEANGIVTLTDDRDRTRVLHENGREELVQLDAGPIGAVTKRERGELVVHYRLDADRELRRRYSRDADANRLIVREQLSDHNRGEVITRVYEAAP